MLGSGYVEPFAEAIPSGGTPYGPGYIQSQNPAAWFRFGMGITVATGVSQWSDQTANARHLLQATAGAQPALQTDGSILFDGIAHFLQTGGFTLNQPTTVYFLGKIVAWTQTTYVFDGNSDNTGALKMTTGGASPQIGIQASGASIVGPNSNLALNTYGVVAAVFNSTSSVLQVNNTTPSTGDAGTGNMGGFTVGRPGTSGAPFFGNIQVKEAILFPVPHNESVRAGVVRYLAGVGGLAV